MGLKNELDAEVKSFLISDWKTRKGTVIPEAEDIRLGNDAVTFEEAVVLYADLAGSTQLVESRKDWFAAEVYKSFLHCATRIIKANGGVVTAFDGDRVMAVFIGDYKRTSAAKTALQINGAVVEVVNPQIHARYSDTSHFFVKHAVGVDMSKLFVARTGVRGANDLVWVGRSANYAAKLSDVRDGSYCSFITAAVYEKLNDEAKINGDPKRNMWEQWWWEDGGVNIYRSSWRWTP